MTHDFDLIYIGESLEAYLDIAQNDLWEKSAIASEARDRKNNDLIIISESDLKKFQDLSRSKNLSSFLKGFDQFKPFPFVLHFHGERVLLGRKLQENKLQLERCQFHKKISTPQQDKVLKNAFQVIFWNTVTQNPNYLEQSYFSARKEESLQYYKDSYCQNNGTYIIGEVSDLSLKKPRSISFDSLWGKCLTEEIKIDQFSRLQGRHHFSQSKLISCYEKITLLMEVPEEFELIPQLFVDVFLKDQWVPFSFLHLQGRTLVLDVYARSDQTLKSGYLEKIAKAFLAKINRDYQIPLKAQVGLVHRMVFTADSEQKLASDSHFKLIDIS